MCRSFKLKLSQSTCDPVTFICPPAGLLWLCSVSLTKSLYFNSNETKTKGNLENLLYLSRNTLLSETSVYNRVKPHFIDSWIIIELGRLFNQSHRQKKLAWVTSRRKVHRYFRVQRQLSRGDCKVSYATSQSPFNWNSKWCLAFVLCSVVATRNRQ